MSSSLGSSSTMQLYLQFCDWIAFQRQEMMSNLNKKRKLTLAILSSSDEIGRASSSGSARHCGCHAIANDDVDQHATASCKTKKRMYSTIDHHSADVMPEVMEVGSYRLHSWLIWNWPSFTLMMMIQSIMMMIDHHHHFWYSLIVMMIWWSVL